MKRFSPFALAVAAALVPILAAFPAAAHPVPGMTGVGAGLAHPFMGLDHLLAMVAVGLLAGLKGGRVSWALPALFVTFVVAGALVGLGLQGHDVTEIAVAFSVFAFGGAVAFSRSVPMTLAAPLIAVFAALHGFAHGTEAPAEGALAFIAGMAISTLALHLTGVFAVRVAALRDYVRPAGGAIALAGLLLMFGMV